MYEARDALIISDIAYIDVVKAFDKVSHSKLLHKYFIIALVVTFING